jgi:hypothetical protein
MLLNCFATTGTTIGKRTFFSPRFIAPHDCIIKSIFFDTHHFKNSKSQSHKLHFIIDNELKSWNLEKSSDSQFAQFEIESLKIPANKTLEVFSEQSLGKSSSVIFWFCRA